MSSAPPSPSPSPSPPTFREGRYVVVGTLGAGSQGETFEAVDKREGRVVALKRFTIRGARSWKDVELAEREARVLSSLSHSSLPRYIDHFEENGALLLVMEKVEGESLAARRKRGARLDTSEVVRFLWEVGASLAYLHGQAPPVVHRDIKPGNVIRRPDGSFCLVDFGSVRDHLKPEGGSTVVGTFGFMAPEQFQGRAMPGSDVYAVGATALCLLTGSEPEDLPHKGLRIDVERALSRQAPEALVRTLALMLEPDPERRPSSVLEALQRTRLAAPGSASFGAGRRAAAREAPESADARYSQARDAARSARSAAQAAREHHEEARKAARRARRQRKAERRAARHAPTMHGVGLDERHGMPFVLVGVLFLVGLRLAAMATFLLFGLLLPLLFSILGLLFGSGLFRTAGRMRELGSTGRQGIALAREFVRYRFLGGPSPAALEEDRVWEEEPDSARDSEPIPRQSRSPAESRPHAPRRSRVVIDAEAEESELADEVVPPSRRTSR